MLVVNPRVPVLLPAGILAPPYVRRGYGGRRVVLAVATPVHALLSGSRHDRTGVRASCCYVRAILLALARWSE